MKVFISWSGELSRQVAKLVHEWIGNVLQGTEPWLSETDIEKGSIWFTELGEQLAHVGFGILCLTPENISAPWILFEAGALSKGLTKNRVCPLLIQLEPPNLKPPLSQFNAALPVKDDMRRLVAAINAAQQERILEEAKLEKTFSRWWGEFDENLRNILAQTKSAIPAKRSPNDMIEEILDIVRSLQRANQAQLPIEWQSSALTSYADPRKAPLEELIERLRKLEEDRSNDAEQTGHQKRNVEGNE